MIGISEATPEDYPFIQQIAYKTWPVTYGRILSKEQLEYMLDLFYSMDAIGKSVSEQGHRLLMAKDENHYIGFASYENYFQQKPVTRIHKIYVIPEAQGRGIGRILIGRISELALQNDCKSLSLNVNRKNNARQFYAKLDFEVVGEEDIPIGQGYLMEDYIMEKQLFQNNDIMFNEQS